MRVNLKLVLCRSDNGDGGWSLHPPHSTDEAIAEGKAPALLSGTAKWDESTQEWTRPNIRDFAQATLRLNNL